VKERGRERVVCWRAGRISSGPFPLVLYYLSGVPFFYFAGDPKKSYYQNLSDAIKKTHSSLTPIKEKSCNDNLLII
jgi:hypothetical protein